MHSEHTFRQFDTELESVRSKVLSMGGLVEQQVLSAIEALVSGDSALADRVIATDATVNGLEVTIDDDINHIIARRQPAAVDLRMLITAIKTTTDLERIGDEAEKIARKSKLIHGAGRPTLPRVTELRLMGDMVVEMLRKSLDSFARLDVSGTPESLRQDERVDEEFAAIVRQLITYMMEDPRTISTFLEMMFIAKAIERIGDHSKNIAEYVVYLVKGKDIRHIAIDEIERTLLS